MYRLRATKQTNQSLLSIDDYFVKKFFINFVTKTTQIPQRTNIRLSASTKFLTESHATAMIGCEYLPVSVVCCRLSGHLSVSTALLLQLLDPMPLARLLMLVPRLLLPRDVSTSAPASRWSVCCKRCRWRNERKRRIPVALRWKKCNRNITSHILDWWPAKPRTRCGGQDLPAGMTWTWVPKQLESWSCRSLPLLS